MYTLVVVLGLGTIASADVLVMYDLIGSSPIAWLPALLACVLAIYLMARTDFLRSRGFDRGVLVELGGFVVAAAVIAYITLVAPGGSPLALALLGAVVWAIVTASAWGLMRRRPVRVIGERRLGDFVARVAELADEVAIVEGVSTLWRSVVGVELHASWTVAAGTPGTLGVAVGGDARWPLDAAVASWLVAHGEPLAIADLATMRLGLLRGPLEALGATGTTLVRAARRSRHAGRARRGEVRPRAAR